MIFKDGLKCLLVIHDLQTLGVFTNKSKINFGNEEVEYLSHVFVKNEHGVEFQAEGQIFEDVKKLIPLRNSVKDYESVSRAEYSTGHQRMKEELELQRLLKKHQQKLESLGIKVRD